MMNKKQELTLIIEAIISDLAILVPTDTICGLLSNPYSKKAIDNLYEIKERPREKNFAIFIHPDDLVDYFDFKNEIDIRNYKLFQKLCS